MTKETDPVTEVFPGFEAGEVISFETMAQLVELEDWLPSVLDPTLDESISPSHAKAWAGRIALTDILRPSDFHGGIIDITLTVKSEAYADLKKAATRHVNFALGSPARIPRTKIEPSAYLGFDFLGHLKSSGGGKICPVTSELWYVRLPDNRVVDNYATDDRYRDFVHTTDSMTDPDSMMRVRRIITRPSYDRSAIENTKKVSAERSHIMPDVKLKAHR